jgi:hypothetical protein
MANEDGKRCTDDQDVAMEEECMQPFERFQTIDPNGVKARILVSSSMKRPALSTTLCRCTVQANGNRRVEYRRVRCPTHRYAPLRKHCISNTRILTQYFYRSNTKTRIVEMKIN